MTEQTDREKFIADYLATIKGPIHHSSAHFRKYKREYEQNYREENRDHILERTREWKKNNPDKVAGYRTKFKAESKY